MSNCCSINPIQVKNKKKPELCIKYNSSMGYEDIFNQDLSLYLYRHRKSKWTKCAFYAIFQISLVNSWTLFCLYKKELNLNSFY